MQYIGIADAHGLESFLSLTGMEAIDLLEGKKETNNTKTMMSLRASANRHRHAVVYIAKLQAKDAEKIREMVNKEKIKEALITLKEVAEEIQLARMPGAEKSWKMIPNDDLDPFS